MVHLEFLFHSLDGEHGKGERISIQKVRSYQPFEDNGGCAQLYDQGGGETRSTYVIYRLQEISASEIDR